MKSSRSDENAHNDRIGIASALLALQGSLGLMALIGIAVFQRIEAPHAGLSGPERLALFSPIAAFVMSFGLYNLWKWARRAAIMFEGLALVGGLFQTLIVAQGGLDLMTPLSTLALPALVLAMLLGRATRTAVSPPRPLHP